MAKKRKTEIPEVVVSKPPAPSTELSAVETSERVERVKEIHSLPPYIGVGLRKGGVRRKSLLFLLALTADEKVAAEYEKVTEKDARLRGKAESAAIVERAVRSNLNKLTGEITPHDRASIMELDLSGTDLTDVTPLKGLTGLQRLDLYGTQVSNVTPLTVLRELRDLELSETQVSDITSLAKMTELQYLDLAGTQVSNVTPLAGLTGLQHLDLMNTKVSDVTPLAGLAELQHLDLMNTKVTDVTPLAGLAELQYLGLMNTKVTDVRPLDGIKGLTIVGP